MNPKTIQNWSVIGLVPFAALVVFIDSAWKIIPLVIALAFATMFGMAVQANEEEN